MKNPYQVVHDFESALCDYTGAPYCVTTTSCTTAILLAMSWVFERWRGSGQYEKFDAFIPRFTYVGVPMSIIHAGGEVYFDDREWEGAYEISPAAEGFWSRRVADHARWLTCDMYASGVMQCLSFHPTKHLGISTGGGAILHDNPEADKWLRMARFDGRQEGVEPRKQKDWVMGYHANMSPSAAAEGLLRLSTLPRRNEPLPNSDYPDLSKLEIFK